MSIPDDYAVVTVTSSDATIRVDVTWDFGSDLTQLIIQQQEALTGLTRLYSEGGYTVTVQNDGSVYLDVEKYSAYSGNVVVTVKRSTPKTQTYDVAEDTALDAAALTAILDKLMKISQEAVVNSVSNAVTSVNPFDVPASVTRAGKLLKFDSNGDVTVGTVSESLDDVLAWCTEWANKAEDSLISASAGGDTVDDYSALHHAAKASTSETNAAASAAAAAISATTAQKALSATLNYDTSTTDADPGNGDIRLNNAALASVTEVYYDDQDANAVSIEGMNDIINADDLFYIEESGVVNNSALYRVTAVTDNAGYTKLDVVHLYSTGSLPAGGTAMKIQIFPKPPSTVKEIAQIAYTEDATYVSDAASIPEDDTIPQDTEGAEYTQLATAFTPQNASSKLFIEIFIPQAHCANDVMNICLFEDGVSDAIAHANSMGGSAANSPVHIDLKVQIDASSTSARTYKVRYGSQSTSVMYINGNSTSRQYGGVNKSFMRITEILP